MWGERGGYGFRTDIYKPLTSSQKCTVDGWSRFLLNLAAIVNQQINIHLHLSQQELGDQKTLPWAWAAGREGAGRAGGWRGGRRWRPACRRALSAQTEPSRSRAAAVSPLGSDGKKISSKNLIKNIKSSEQGMEQ
jgi:hypothetical protein